MDPIAESTDATAATHLISGRESQRVLSGLKQELNRIQRTVRRTLEAKLHPLQGQNLGDLQANRDLAESIQALLDTHSLRIRCPQCDQPAILRVSPRKGMPGGAFVLDHTIEGRRTFHGGTSGVPMIRLTAKPSRSVPKRKSS
ncbi:MAG: hypothetical protein AAGJ40_13900 [Planctomycetota bacterium]